MTLKSLEEHNKERRSIYEVRQNNDPCLNGIACPECGAELFDTNPDRICMSKPPQKRIHCSACSYKGYRIA